MITARERNCIATNESGVRQITIVDCFDFGRVQQQVSLDKWVERLRLLNRILSIRGRKLLKKYHCAVICGNGVLSSHSQNTDGSLITAVFHELKCLQQNIFKRKFRVFLLFL